MHSITLFTTTSHPRISILRVIDPEMHAIETSTTLTVIAAVALIGPIVLPQAAAVAALVEYSGGGHPSVQYEANLEYTVFWKSVAMVWMSLVFSIFFCLTS